MKLFREYTFKWWQVGLLKVYVVSIGLLLGAYFPETVLRYKNILLAIFVILMVYFLHALLTKEM